MLPSRSFPFVACVALGAVALTGSSALAQGYGSRYGGYVDDEEVYGAPVPPRPIPDYRRGAVETVVTTTRRIVTSRPSGYAYGDPDDDGPARRVIVPAPVRRHPPADVVVTTGSVPPRLVHPGDPVYKSEPVYIPAPPWREEVVAVRPRYPAQPVIIEERRVETTRRILAPAPFD